MYDFLTLYVVPFSETDSGVPLCKIGDTEVTAILRGEYLDISFDPPCRRFDTTLSTYEADKIAWLASLGYEVKKEDLPL